jgi:peptidoglycan hydrolase CwlO-like protein
LADTKTKIPYEKNPHQKIHDIAVALGAECCNGFSEEEKKYAEFLTPQQLKAIQKHHDMAVADGAFCSDYQDRVKSGLNVHKARMGYMSDFKKDELSDEAKAAFSKLEADLNAAEKEKAELSKKVESLETEFSSTQKELTESQTKFSETQSTFSATQADFTAKLKVLEDTLTQFGKENEQLLAAKEASEKTALISEAKSYFAEKRDAFVLTANEAEKHFARVSEDPSLFSTIKSILDIQEPRKELAPVGKLTNSFSKFRDQNINNGDENPLQTLNKFCMDEDNKKKYGGFAGVHEHLRATNDPIFVNAMENYK